MLVDGSWRAGGACNGSHSLSLSLLTLTTGGSESQIRGALTSADGAHVREVGRRGLARKRGLQWLYAYLLIYLFAYLFICLLTYLRTCLLTY